MTLRKLAMYRMSGSERVSVSLCVCVFVRENEHCQELKDFITSFNQDAFKESVAMISYLFPYKDVILDLTIQTKITALY